MAKSKVAPTMKKNKRSGRGRDNRGRFVKDMKQIGGKKATTIARKKITKRKPVVPDTKKNNIPQREYQPDNPSDTRRNLAEKLLLGEELAQYAFGTTGSFQIYH